MEENSLISIVSGSLTQFLIVLTVTQLYWIVYRNHFQSFRYLIGGGMKNTSELWKYKHTGSDPGSATY